jgi:triacylglycerol lipase
VTFNPFEKIHQQVSNSARLFKRTIKEVGASVVAINLYPLGIFERGTSARRHSAHSVNPRPILFVHGVVHNWSAFVTLKRGMSKLNWENLYTFNYGTIHNNVLQMVDALGEKVDQILIETGAKQIDLIGHSLGGIVARTFMTLGEGRGKVHTLVTLGTPHQGTNLSFFAKGFSRGALDKDLKANSFLIRLLHETALPKSSKVISIYSPFDWTVRPAKNAEAIGLPESCFENVKLDDIGHAGLLYSEEAFDAVVRGILKI